MIYIKVTPNRPDALGVYGIARDLAAKGLGKLKPLAAKPVRRHIRLADQRVAAISPAATRNPARSSSAAISGA